MWDKEEGLTKRSRLDAWDKEEGLRKGPVQLFETRRKGLKKVQSSCVGQVVRWNLSSTQDPKQVDS